MRSGRQTGETDGPGIELSQRRMGLRSRRRWVILCLTLALGCEGKIVGRDGPGGGTPSASSLKMGPTGAHRLSRDEYDNTVRDLVGDTAGAVSYTHLTLPTS